MGEPHQDDLITKAQDGGPEAAGKLYEQHQRSIFRYLYYRIGDQQVAEDLTGDVFLKMVQALPGFRGNIFAFRGWLFQIARNLSIDHLRRILAHPHVNIQENLVCSDEPTELTAERSLNADTLRRAIAHLNDEQKDVIILRFIEGMSLAETARTLHKSEDAVKGLQRRALQILRDQLLKQEHEYEPGRNPTTLSAPN